MRRAIYPGTFDPLTMGHYDIIERASALFDELVVGVATNPKKGPAFTAEQRVEMTRLAVAHLPNVRVEAFSCLLMNFMKQQDAKIIIRGLRAVSDFEFEFQLALMNRKLYPECETIFLMPNKKYIFLSSSMLKEIASLGGDIRCFVPAPVYPYVKDHYDLPQLLDGDCS